LKDLNSPAAEPALLSAVDGTASTQVPQFSLGSVLALSEDGALVAVRSRFPDPGSSTGSHRVGIHVRTTAAPGDPPELVSSAAGAAKFASVQADQGVYTENITSFSGDGRYAAVLSPSANLLPGAAGYQIYVKDLARPTAALRLASSADGTTATQANPPATHTLTQGQISGNGRYVVFQSAATNLVTGASCPQLYRKDLQTLSAAPLLVSSGDGTTATMADMCNTNQTFEAQISEDGRYVLFESRQTTMVPGLPNQWNIFVKDLDNPTVAPKIVSSVDGTAGTVANGSSDYGRITPDGRYAVFQSAATNLVSGSSGTQVFRKDLTSLSSPPVLVSSNDGTGANRGNGTSSRAAISADGRYVLFVSTSSNFVAGASGTQLYLKDLNNLGTPPVLVSSSDGTAANRENAGVVAFTHVDISADGRYALFAASGTNLVAGASGTQLYLKDLQNLAAAPKLVSSLDGTAATQSNSSCSAPRLSADNRYAIFGSAATNLVRGLGGQTQLYVRDLTLP
jgi:hypothetical protein